nr:EOG090X0A8N [Leptodora kindtii]
MSRTLTKPRPKKMSTKRRRKLVYISIIAVAILFLIFFLSSFNGRSDYEVNGVSSAVLDDALPDLDSSRRGSKVRLLIIVVSSPTKSATRSVIRETWLSDRDARYRHFFVVGVAGLSSSVADSLADESAAHGDILTLSNLADSYQNLADKVLGALSLVSGIVHFDHVLKCDDDSFVRVSRLLDEIEKQPQERLYWGFFKGGSTVHRKGKWQEPEWFLCDTYLPYALGGGYILSVDLVRHLVINAGLLQQYRSEDVSVGTWLSPLRINRVHDVRFDTEFASRGCHESYLITHKQSPEEMRKKHHHLKSTGKLCPEGHTRSRYSYAYNWTVPPSKCCKDFDVDLP